MSFSVGDVVTLKSGGPTMTVASVFTAGEAQSVWVKARWFCNENIDCRESDFPVEMLAPFEKPAVAGRAGPPRRMRQQNFY